MTNITARSVISILLIWTSAGGFAAGSSNEAVGWLGKMAEAMRHQNYQGIFSYIRGSNFDTVRIVHHSEDGIETERLINMNGEVRETQLFNLKTNPHEFIFEHGKKRNNPPPR